MKLIGCCGVVCSECPGYLATQNDDWDERKRVAEMWSKIFNVKLTAEYVNCDGCTGGGRVIDYCKTCEIRKCAVSKNLDNCAFCTEYPCEKLEKWFEHMPEAREVLEEIRKTMGKGKVK